MDESFHSESIKSEKAEIQNLGDDLKFKEGLLWKLTKKDSLKSSNS